MKNQENDLEEIAKILAFAFLAAWIPFAIIEIHNPAVEKKLRYEKECNAKGGFVYEAKNEDKRCIKKDYITITL